MDTVSNQMFRFASRSLVMGLLLGLLLSLSAQAQFYSPNGITVAGGRGAGSAANQLNQPYGVFVDQAGSVYVVDVANFRIQKWAAGATSGLTVAGGNGIGSAANQVAPTGVALDGAGAIYVVDYLNNRVLKFPPNSTSATSGVTVAGGNGVGSAANQLNEPYGMFVDQAGSVYVADGANYRIQKFPPNSTSATPGVTVAGGNGVGTADNKLNYPTAVYVDGSGAIYVADRGNGRIQKFPPNSTSATSGVTVAGGTVADFIDPVGVYVDESGAVYVTDQSNNRIQRFPPNWPPPNFLSNIVEPVTVAGGNGAGSAANQLNQPCGMFADQAGSIYVADQSNNRIQKFIACPAITAQPPLSQALCAGSTGSISVATTGPISAYQWFKDGTALTSPASATTASLSLSPLTAASAGNYRLQISGNSGCSSLSSTVSSLSVLSAPSGLASASSSTVLVGGTVSLSASGGSSYQWGAPAGTFLSFPTSESLVRAILPSSGLQTFSVVVANQVGCSQSLTVGVTALLPADLSPLLYVLPISLYGSSPVSVVVDVVELNGVASSGLITLKISQQAGLSLSLPATETSVDGRSVSNSAWQLSGPSGGYYTLTTNQAVGAGNKLSVGLRGSYSGGSGGLTVSASVSGGGDRNLLNNTDADRVEYFQQ